MRQVAAFALTNVLQPANRVRSGFSQRTGSAPSRQFVSSIIGHFYAKDARAALASWATSFSLLFSVYSTR